MISIQININTTFIAHVYIRNIQTVSKDKCVYSWSYYMPDNGLICGEIYHYPIQGLETLIYKVMLSIKNETNRKSNR